MNSNDAEYLKNQKYFKLIIESLVETIEMYNYSIRFYGSLDHSYITSPQAVKIPESFVMRIDLFEDGPEEGVNGTCTFFDELSQQDMNLFLEFADAERQRLTTLLKEALIRGDKPKFYIELENGDSTETDHMERKSFINSVSRDIINIKFEHETGNRRNYFS